MALPQDFCHLQVHSECSLLDSTCRIDELCARAAELGMTSLALTDIGNFFGAVEFYKAAKANKIKAIFGCEVNIASRSHKDKEPYVDKKTTRIVLLAKDKQGYQNLIKLISISHVDGFYYRARVDLALLKLYRDGLICLSGGLNGHIAAAILQHQEPLAIEQRALDLKDIFGENFYLEINHHSVHDQSLWVPQVIQLSKKLNIPLVLTNDVYYLSQADSAAHDALLCIGSGKLLSDPARFKLMSDQYYLKSPTEMATLFPDIPAAYENTLKIADQCNVNLKLGVTLLPHFDVPAEFTLTSYLRNLSEKGLKGRYGVITENIEQRLNYELSVIEQMGYEAYFLIVYDFIDWARKNGIEVGPGRGSAAGSLVAYCLGITNIDPLKYNLLFERFLNPERVSMPDIDVDFCIRRRHEVLQYVARKYGDNHVAQIITFGTMAARAVIRDVGRVMDVPLPLVDKAAKLVPQSGTEKITLQMALDQVPELRELRAKDVQVSRIIETGLKLEGLSRHASTHAAGVVISKDPIDTMVPLAVNDGQKVTQFTMGDLEAIGLLKMDFLGLRNLTMLGDALVVIKRTQNKDIHLSQLPLDDKETYRQLSAGKTIGVFQLESSGMQQLIVDLKPSCFEDIIALLALYRPGPLGSGMVSEFISNKHGKTAVTYMLPQLEPILRETYGLILYQEQVMQIASVIGGFSLGEADVMRRAMGKKKKAEMAQLRQQFIEGAKKNEVPEQKAATIFDLCAKFAEYGFNKSHSAAYALVSYQTAYLKTNFPLEYMAALLTSMLGSMDKITLYINECHDMGIDILPPDINESLVDFNVESSSIRFGLGAIKNVGEAAIENILKVRADSGPFQSLANFCHRVDLRLSNKRVLESLIKSGCFDVFGNRAQHLAVVESTVDNALRSAKEKAQGQSSLFELMATQSEGVQQHWSAPTLPQIPELDTKQKLKFEKELLGLYISDHPLAAIKEALEKQTNATTQTLESKKDGDKVVIGGLIQGTRKLITKSQKQMMFAQLEDMVGSVELVIFPGKPYDTCSDFIRDDGCVIVQGTLRVDNNTYKILVDAVRLFEITTRTYNIELDQDDLPKLESIKTILLEHRGANPVVFHYNGQKIQSGQTHWVNGEAIFISKVEELVGHGKVWPS